MSYRQHSCNLCHTVRTVVVQFTLSALLQSPSDCQNWSTACHAVSTAAHHTFSVLLHNIGTTKYLLSTLARHKSLCQHCCSAYWTVHAHAAHHRLPTLVNWVSHCQRLFTASHTFNSTSTARSTWAARYSTWLLIKLM